MQESNAIFKNPPRRQIDLTCPSSPQNIQNTKFSKKKEKRNSNREISTKFSKKKRNSNRKISTRKEK